MAISVLDLFTIGIGPSSSHCVGPMRAACYFAGSLRDSEVIAKTARIFVELYGSLALTGLGHGTDKAILLGLAGETPETVNPDGISEFVHEVEAAGQLTIAGRELSFSLARNLQLRSNELLPLHSNGMRFKAFDESNQKIH